MSVEETKAFKEGLEAKKDGKPNRNPYKQFTKEEAWNAGWKSEASEAQNLSLNVLLASVVVAELAALAWIWFVM